MDWPAQLGNLLDHDWIAWYLLPGLVAAALIVIAWLGDRRRMNRSDPDAVGLVPWRDVAFWSALAAVMLLGLALRGWLTSDVPIWP